MNNEDTTITITIPGEWNEKLRYAITHWPELLEISRDGNMIERDVKSLALKAWHEAQQPPHELEVGDLILKWPGGSPVAGPHLITAIGRDAGLVLPYGCSRENSEPRSQVDGALVRTKDGREVIAHWPNP